MRGRRGRVLIFAFVFGPAIVLGLLGLWGFAPPDGFGAHVARLGAETAREWVGRALTLFSAAVLTVFLVGAIGMPWDAVARTVRPTRRRRLWAYHAAKQGRGPSDFLEVLRQEHEERVRVWHRKLRGGRGRAAVLFAWVDPLCRRFMVAGLLLFAAWMPLFSLLELRPERAGVVFGCGLPLMFPVLGVVALSRYRLALRRLLRTLEHSRCPDCGYDLFDIPPALPRDKVPGAGPARCPECGSMWPLVPPPIDIDA